ncbi:MAG: hypothetical protein PHQ33_03065 [Bacteroidales bacterium]|jgi:hypothetical protein|nr:hypothetical protein [Bacteroidales bacterium]MDD4394849.1 hypothetical protein [Bacteroidales bacterium]
MRRKLLILCIVWLISLSGMAQSLPKMSFQAVVRNANNELITNASVSVTVSFINFSPSGTVVYSEAHNVRSNQNGLISLLVGDGSVLSGSMEEIIWNDTYIKTEITADGYTVTDTKPATAVPIALYAENIPLQALQEHLGSTDLVSGEELRDTLSNYMTQEAAQNYFDNNNNVTADRLYDTLRYYVMTQAMSSTLQNISEQLSDLQSIKNKVDEFTIPSSPNNTFTLTYSPLTEREVLMYINGIFVSTSAFTYSANQLIYIPTNNGNKTLVANDRIQIYYYYQR